MNPSSTEWTNYCREVLRTNLNDLICYYFTKKSGLEIEDVSLSLFAKIVLHRAWSYRIPPKSFQLTVTWMFCGVAWFVFFCKFLPESSDCSLKNGRYFCTFWLKTRMCFGNRVLLFSSSHKLALFDIIRQSGHIVRTVKSDLFSADFCSLPRFLLCKLPNHWQKNDLSWRDVILLSIFLNETLAVTCFTLFFSIKLLRESWCSIYYAVNRISDNASKCLLRSVISIDKSEWVTKLFFRCCSKSVFWTITAQIRWI